MDLEKYQACWYFLKLINQLGVQLFLSTVLYSVKIKYPQITSASMQNIELQVLFLLHTIWLFSSLIILAQVQMQKMFILMQYTLNRISKPLFIFLMQLCHSCKKISQCSNKQVKSSSRLFNWIFRRRCLRCLVWCL